MCLGNRSGAQVMGFWQAVERKQVRGDAKCESSVRRSEVRVKREVARIASHVQRLGCIGMPANRPSSSALQDAWFRHPRESFSWVKNRFTEPLALTCRPLNCSWGSRPHTFPPARKARAKPLIMRSCQQARQDKLPQANIIKVSPPYLN